MVFLGMCLVRSDLLAAVLTDLNNSLCMSIQSMCVQRLGAQTSQIFRAGQTKLVSLKFGDLFKSVQVVITHTSPCLWSSWVTHFAIELTKINVKVTIYSTWN